MASTRELYEEGLEAAQRGEYPRAQECFSGVCEMEPCGEYHAALGNVYLLLGDTAQALEHLKLACDMEPTRPEHRSDLAAVLLAKGMVREAVQFYEEAIEGEPQNPEYYYRLGCVHLYHRQDPARAVQALTQAVAFFPTHADYQKGLGLALFHAGRHGEAAVALRAACSLKPGESIDHYNLACALYGAGDFASAAQAAADALDDDDDEWDVKAVNLWARSLYRSGQLPEARDALGQAVTLEPENAGLFAMLGDALSRLDEPEPAARAFQKAGLLEPGKAEHAYHEGTAFLRAGDSRRARSALRRAVELHPENAQAHNNLALAELVEGDPRAAQSAIERALALEPGRAEFLVTQASVREALV